MQQSLELQQMQEQINSLVYQTFSGITGYDDFSVPLVPRISPQYLENRFVLMGQETNTWYADKKDECLGWVRDKRFKEFSESSLDEMEQILQIERYDRFCNSSSITYGGAFWTFTRYLYNDGVISGPMVSNGFLSHVWMNLFCIENCVNKKDNSGRPSQSWELADRVMMIQKDLVFKILEIIKPKVILATVGYENDYFLKRYALQVDDLNSSVESIDPLNIFNTNHMCQFVVNDVSHPLYGTTILRTYHPSFFLNHINKGRVFKNIAARLNEEGIQKKKSQYYYSVVKDKLINSL